MVIWDVERTLHSHGYHWRQQNIWQRIHQDFAWYFFLQLVDYLQGCYTLHDFQWVSNFLHEQSNNLGGTLKFLWQQLLECCSFKMYHSLIWNRFLDNRDNSGDHAQAWVLWWHLEYWLSNVKSAKSIRSSWACVQETELRIRHIGAYCFMCCGTSMVSRVLLDEADSWNGILCDIPERGGHWYHWFRGHVLHVYSDVLQFCLHYSNVSFKRQN